MYSGVPQEEVLSLLYSNVTMDYILNNMEPQIRLFVENGNVLAYADDLVINTYPEENEISNFLLNT
ncbi:unnamed protein product [Moneuplotes crassus]|uniref:Reverse transcriptase domain-containing protein n=1 Tax=Euplotes crassus TaxID=5936 RepID=A0AAD1XDR7_EUPCR|nr:unnamed protein product [Moneuplotes crassus]